MVSKIKQFIKQYNSISWFLHTVKVYFNKYKLEHGSLSIQNEGTYKILKYVNGGGNRLIIGKNTFLNNTSIHIVGNNNTIKFGDNVNVGSNCSFWCEGNNVEIVIGDNTTFTLSCHINAQEDNSRITIGNDCMISNNIIIRTSDSHPIMDLETHNRLNPARDINIEDHVWIAPQTIIMKGVTIGKGTIIGSRTFVTKNIPEYSLAVGAPARVVKSNVSWTRDDIIFGNVRK